MLFFGVDILIQQNPSWKNKRIALVTNNAATTNYLQPSRLALLQNGFNIVQLFSPEHGLNTKGIDGAFINNSIDELTQLPIISLYSKKLQPSQEDLANIDVILFDIPDIGCRFYTYLWTMTYVMEAAAKYNKPLIILDRPNPISGNFSLTEGASLDENYCSSFIGRWSIPLRHSCTIGELALYFNKAKNIHAKIEIIPCKNWNRNMFQTDWNIAFVPTSPAIKNFNSMLLYCGLGLLEATNISEGRGTENSFEIAGTPYFNNKMLCNIFNTIQDEVELETKNFIPKESKYANELCNGILFKIKNKTTFRPVFTALLFIKMVKDCYPKNFKWSNYKTLVNPSGVKHLDKLLGTANSEDLFNLPMQHFLSQVEKITTVYNWQKETENYLLY